MGGGAERWWKRPRRISTQLGGAANVGKGATKLAGTGRIWLKGRFKAGEVYKL